MWLSSFPIDIISITYLQKFHTIFPKPGPHNQQKLCEVKKKFLFVVSLHLKRMEEENKFIKQSFVALVCTVCKKIDS